MKTISLKNFSAGFILLALTVLVGSASAQTPPTVKKIYEIDLSWTANTEEDLAGYRVYRGRGAATCNDTVTPLPPLVTAAQTQPPIAPSPEPTYHDSAIEQVDGLVCYEVTAFDTSDNESPRSNRVAALLNANPPSAPQGLGLGVVIR